MPTESNDHRLTRFGKNGSAWFSGNGLLIFTSLMRPQLRHFFPDYISAQRRGRSLRSLYCRSHGTVAALP
ncbi:MAG: hypothetical protein GX413_00545 [Acetobacter sp.]|nr:hypothetical protein [Acetobacter sp.]